MKKIITVDFWKNNKNNCLLYNQKFICFCTTLIAIDDDDFLKRYVKIVYS